MENKPNALSNPGKKIQNAGQSASAFSDSLNRSDFLSRNHSGRPSDEVASKDPVNFYIKKKVFNLFLYPLGYYFLVFSCAYVDIVLFVSIYGFLDLIFHFGAFWRFAIESKIFQMERIGVQLFLLGHLQDV